MILFDKAMKFVGLIEGGYINDPNDKGGETKYGISKKSYPHLDIKNLTKEQAKEIYYNNYWLKNGCDKMHPINENKNGCYHNNKLNIRGVCLNKRNGKYRAYLNINKKSKEIGQFKTKEEAEIAVIQARKNFMLFSCN